MPKLSLKTQIQRINDYLKQANIPVRVRLNGKVLGLRATLPLKSGIGKKQQDLRLGIPVTVDGLREIETQAHQLGKEISTSTFSWSHWERDRATKLDEIPASQLVQNFKVQYLKANRIKESTWRYGWQKTLERLPQDKPLTEADVLAVILATEPHTDTRKRTCQRLQVLCEYAGIKIDLSKHSGNYGHQSLNPRDIPSDDLIVEWRNKIPNAQWQWVYGMMATFGLRPHECFFCEFVDVHTVRVLDETKTGYHVTRAIPPDWAEQWNLIEVKCPKVSGHRPSDYGDRNKRQFQRYKIPFPAYNLRHAYAIRGSITEGLPVSTMASMMGHSAAVHQKQYHHWLTDATNQEVYARMILAKRTNPPKTPL
ncbi:MAG: hypothetical protein KME10_19280 [Plectolyngbya sp. WJT66-NPBG17]|jgi:integrase|nr:hypothetical protein [Plectolyngbya sp. WJT66-NPBG17]